MSINLTPIMIYVLNDWGVIMSGLISGSLVFFFLEKINMNENIYTAILLAAIATYLCRASGVYSIEKKIYNSNIFRWIEYISMGIIISVITKMIIFPEGILAQNLLNDKTNNYIIFVDYILFN